MISFLKKLLKDWQTAGSEGPDPLKAEMAKMELSARRRVHREIEKEARWNRRRLATLTVFQLARMNRRAVRFDSPQTVQRIETEYQRRLQRSPKTDARAFTGAATAA